MPNPGHRLATNRKQPLAAPLQAVDSFVPVPVNFRIGDQRTSVRIDPVTLEALDRLGAEEGLTRHQIAALVAGRMADGMSFSGALRAFVLAYWLRRGVMGEDPA